MSNQSTSGLLSPKQRVVSGLALFLQPMGFVYVAQWNQFRRPTQTGFQSIIISMANYSDVSLLEIHLGVRQDTVENLAYPFTNGLLGFKPNSMTLVTPLAKLHGHSFQRFEVSISTDLRPILQEIQTQLNKGGFSFLDKYISLNELDNLFNRHPNHPLPLVHNQVNRCIRGIVMSKINKQPGFEALTQMYRDRLEALRVPQQTLDKYDRLRSYLRSYSSN